jgi:hypothetical protein
MSTSTGVPALRRVEAIFRNPALYALAECIPKGSHGGGRPRAYPDYMLLGYEALISVYGSARQVEAELSHPLVWGLIRRIVAECFPADPSMRLAKRPMRRHHYLYGRDRHLADSGVFAELQALHRDLAADQARELGLLDPDGPGSWTHPHPSRMLHADGKVLTPLFRAKPGDVRVDCATGEILPARAEPDGGLHFEGTGDAAWGTKFVLVAVRSTSERGRIILDLEWVPDPGGEAAGAIRCFERLAPLLPGAQGVVYDTALRGVHHQRLLRDLGLMPINKVAAAEKGSSEPRRSKGRRVEKSTWVEDKAVRTPDGLVTVRLYALAGAIGLGELTDSGDMVFTQVARVRTHRVRDKSGRYRWYNDYALPASYGGGIVTVRLYGDAKDLARRFNRTENVRTIPPSDPDFKRLYGRRNDSESINRDLVDSMWLGRAHSLGHARQLVNLLGYALMVNSLALLEHRERKRPLPVAA